MLYKFVRHIISPSPPIYTIEDPLFVLVEEGWVDLLPFFHLLCQSHFCFFCWFYTPLAQCQNRKNSWDLGCHSVLDAQQSLPSLRRCNSFISCVNPISVFSFGFHGTCGILSKLLNCCSVILYVVTLCQIVVHPKPNDHPNPTNSFYFGTVPVG